MHPEGCHTARQLTDYQVGLTIDLSPSGPHQPAQAGMRPVIVIQHDDRTPTGQRFASFCIRGIPGLVSSSTSMRRWPKGRLFSVAAVLALLLNGSLKSRRGRILAQPAGPARRTRQPAYFGKIAGRSWRLITMRGDGRSIGLSRNESGRCPCHASP